MTVVRVFIAVDISTEARDVLGEVIRRLQQLGVSGFRWVRPDGIHLTLKFLGDIETSTVEGILAAMERASMGKGPLTLGLSGIGAFPTTNNPRVIWVGLKGEVERLKELQAHVDRELFSAQGISREARPFTPHLTLGRERDRVSAEQRRNAGAAMAKVDEVADVWWRIEELNLVRSTLTPSGAEYSLLGSWKLQGQPGERSASESGK